MADTKELRTLMGFAKKVCKKSILKKFKLVKDKQEKWEVLRYSIRARLDIIYYNLEKEIKEKEKKGKNVFFVLIKMKTLKLKIKLFEATYHKKDFENILYNLKEVESELKHV